MKVTDGSLAAQFGLYQIATEPWRVLPFDTAVNHPLAVVVGWLIELEPTTATSRLPAVVAPRKFRDIDELPMTPTFEVWTDEIATSDHAPHLIAYVLHPAASDPFASQEDERSGLHVRDDVFLEPLL